MLPSKHSTPAPKRQTPKRAASPAARTRRPPATPKTAERAGGGNAAPAAGPRASGFDRLQCEALGVLDAYAAEFSCAWSSGPVLPARGVFFAFLEGGPHMGVWEKAPSARAARILLASRLLGLGFEPKDET